MLRHMRLLTLVLLCAAGAVLSIAATPAVAAAATSGVDDDVNAALQKLYAREPKAKMIGEQAKAILVFPNIVKAGFIVGNARFVRGEARFPTVQKEILASLAQGQRPYATILGCSDSRVPPE